MEMEQPGQLPPTEESGDILSRDVPGEVMSGSAGGGPDRSYRRVLVIMVVVIVVLVMILGGLGLVYIKQLGSGSQSLEQSTPVMSASPFLNRAVLERASMLPDPTTPSPNTGSTGGPTAEQLEQVTEVLDELEQIGSSYHSLGG